MAYNQGLNPNFGAEMPWQTNDTEELECAINHLAVNLDLINRRWAQKWFENFQFVLGNQNLKWSRKYDFAFDTDLLAQDATMSNRRAKTNLTRVVVESLSSMLFSQLGELDLQAKYDSSSRAERLIRVLSSLKECYDERLELHNEFDIGSVMAVIYARMYAKISWNLGGGSHFKRNKQQIVKMPKMTSRVETDPLTGQKVTVPTMVLNADGSPVMIDAFEDVLGPDGKPIVEKVRTGDVNIEMITPFEMRCDPNAKTASKWRFVQQIAVMDFDDFMEIYGDDPGLIKDATGKYEIDKIKGGTVAQPIMSLAMRHFLRTVFSAPPSLDYSGRSTTAPMMVLQNKVLVVEHYDRPSDGHRRNPTPWLSEGRRVVVANGKVVSVSTPQYRTNKKDGWHPFVEFKWLPMAPSAESSGPLSDVVDKNRQINLTDNLMQMAIERQSASVMFVNEASMVDKEKLNSGEPGQVLYCTGDPNAAAAYVSDKNPLPSLVNQYRDMQKGEIYEISGAQEAIRGQRTPGANSGYQEKLIEERERKRLSKPIRNWERFVGNCYEKIFCCLQQNAVKIDDSVVARIRRSTDSDVTDSDIMNFLNGPIDYGVDIRLRAFSMLTKSKASQQATVQESLKIEAVAMALAADPSTLDSYLDFMELQPLRGIQSDHRDRAKKENAYFGDMARVKDPEALQAMSADMPVVLWEDADDVHIVEHKRDFIKNYDRYKRNPIILQAIAVHQAYHEQNRLAKANSQDPFVASEAGGMVMRAMQIAAQKKPQDVPQEERNFIEQQQQNLASQMAGQSESNVPPSEQAGQAGGE